MSIRFRVVRNYSFARLLKSGKATVGYNARHALFVHENTQMKLKGQQRRPSKIGAYWDARKGQGTSKYLEGPLRRQAGSGSMGAKIAKGYRSALRTMKSVVTGKNPTKEGLIAGATDLLRESREIVPYEYGTLYRSAFIEYTDKSGTKRIKVPDK